MSGRYRYAILAAAISALAALWLAAIASADYEQVGHFSEGAGAKELPYASGAAVNVTGTGGVEPGSLYVSVNQRVLRFSPMGEFKEAWGWDTVASGPDQSNEAQKVTVKAASGEYTLTANTALGEGNLTIGAKLVTGVTTSFGGTGKFHGFGAFHVGDAITGGGIPSGTTITAMDEGAHTLELSAPATETAGRGLTASETTAPIQATASAAELKAALLVLEGFGPADLTVTGGPGDAEGGKPYEVTFEGAFAGSNVAQMSAAGIGLAGGNPSSVVTVETAVPGAEGYERCRPANGDVCTTEGQGSQHPEGVGHFNGLEGIAVDQATGYVYVLNRAGFSGGIREHNLVEVFSADGSQSIARFGDGTNEFRSPNAESIAESPEKLHNQARDGGPITVTENGTVYLGDLDYIEIAQPPGEARVMCFRPQAPGDYEHYEYCGRSQDIKLGSATTNFLVGLAADDDGNLYGGGETKIKELNPAEPTASPICTYTVPGSNLKALTVNPATGEVFYFAASDNSIHRLKPCNLTTHTFEVAQAAFAPVPTTNRVLALALNPTLAWSAQRPGGILYGLDNRLQEIEGVKYEGIGDVFAPAEVHPPTVESETSFATRTTSTILRAQIDPHGFATHYVFQYLSEAEYEANDPSERFAGAEEAPTGGGEIGGAGVGQVATAISGLQPDTAYRFRVIAGSECDEETGEPCVTDGAAISFATYPATAPGLPDRRAYEMVSPAQKPGGGEVIPAEPGVASCGSQCKPATFGYAFPMQSSSDGEAIAYEGQPFSPTEGASVLNQYLSRRGASGWQTTALSPAKLAYGGGEHLAFDAALTGDLILQRGEGVASPPLSPDAPGEYPDLYAQDTANPGALTPLVTEAPPNRATGNFEIAYAGHSADFSRLFFAANDSLTEETPFAPEAPDPGINKRNLYEWHKGRLTLVNVAPDNASAIAGAYFASPTSPHVRFPANPRAVSEDGSRVFFEDEAHHLYVREGGKVTLEIPGPGRFLTASPDGSEVLLSDGHIYDLETAEVTDLSEGSGGFQGIVGQSDDLSHLYFVDTAVLAANEGAALDEAGNPQFAEAGKSNLYSWDKGGATFIAQLIPSGFSDSADWAANPSERTAEASPHGRWLAFASYAPLSGYDNVGPTCNRQSTGVFFPSSPCGEAFLYDSQTGQLACASCNPTGETPLGRSTLRRIDGTPEWLPQPRYLTDEGRLYFDSGDSLVARDTNEGVEDVYEYEMPGAGAQSTCERQAGCVFLISAGSEPVDSNLLAVDETGRNVFFDTRDKLALKDKDELLDVYDAREGGGIAAESEVSRAECQGEACQTPASAPNDPTPGSSTFEGAGNVKEPAAAKKHAKKKHKRHAKKHKKKRHARHRRAAKRNRGGAK